MNIHVRLNLSKHCIETAIRKAYNQALSAYFKPDSKKQYLEEVIELTQHALERFDFAKLRSEYKGLAGHTQHDVFLFKNNENYTILSNNRVIEPIVKAVTRSK